MSSVVVENIGELVTLAPAAKAKKFVGIKDVDLGRIKNAWLAVREGKVAAFGEGKVDAAHANLKKVDARGGLVMPGFVDAHTHPIFAGSRAHEFARRLNGETYQQIAASGGGIKYTVSQSRLASDAELSALTEKRLGNFLRHGTTTVECKTGYGLSADQELRMLRVLKDVRKKTNQTLSITCLALHALPPEFPSARAFADAMTKDLLPTVASEMLADAVDAFVEKGYFAAADCDEYFAAAKKLGLNVRVHADEFTDSGSAAAAARWGALSADHLEYASDAGIKAMAQAGTVAIALPGTSVYCALPYTNARRFIDAGCPVALATDFNPGSCTIDNINLVATLGAVHCKLTVAEAVAAVTYVAARSLRLEAHKGALSIGHDADFSIFDLPNVDEWIAAAGKLDPWSVVIRGN